MSEQCKAIGTQYLVPLRDAERELNKQMKALQGPGSAPLQRARMSNLVIFCNSLEQSILINEQVTAITAVHPTRTILLVGEPGRDRELTARVTVRPLGLARHHVCVEMVTLHAGGGNVDRLPFAVRALLLGDLPVNLWWEAPVPPPFAGALLYDLGEQAQQIIYDSLGWPDPGRGMTATASWLEQVERGAGAGSVGSDGRWRVASDLNWRRLKYWRRLLTQAFDEASAPGASGAVREIMVEHGPHAVIQAWLLVSWLSRVLGWRVQTGKVTPGKEMSWQFKTPRGDARVGIRRLEEGPPEIRRVRIATTLDGKPVTLEVTPDGPQRLSLLLEGLDTAPRTVTVPPQNAVDLIGRQLSDRERDPVFRESMAVAQVMAQSVRS
jgi:glucose-6-phosphate dehydrogenase assembly protein OpcA